MRQVKQKGKRKGKERKRGRSWAVSNLTPQTAYYLNIYIRLPTAERRREGKKIVDFAKERLFYVNTISLPPPDPSSDRQERGGGGGGDTPPVVPRHPDPCLSAARALK